MVGAVGAEELAGYCAARLASFKVPRYWEFRDDLPRTPSERVAKQLLERSGAVVSFGNDRAGGAVVAAVWPRNRIQDPSLSVGF